MKPQHSITFQKQFNGLTKVTKLKTLDNTLREFKAVQSVISLRKNSILQQTGILPVRTALDSLKNVTYTLEMPKYITLKQYMLDNSDIKQQFIMNCLNSLIKIMKFLSGVIINYISISPTKILIIDNKIMFSLFSLEDENSAYDPQNAGVSLSDAPTWSIAFILDQIYRKQIRIGEFTPIPNLENQRINQFLIEVFIRNKILNLDNIIAFLNPVQSMLCSQHKQPIIKANIKERKLYCSKCLQMQFYNTQHQQIRCRNQMDATIQLFKSTDEKLNNLMRITKGEDTFQTLVLKELVQQSSKQFKEEYSNHIKSIHLPKFDVSEGPQHLNKFSQQIDSYKDQLAQKYQEIIKKKLMSAFRAHLQK